MNLLRVLKVQKNKNPVEVLIESINNVALLLN